MKRRTVKIMGAAERDIIEPHLEAMRRFDRVIGALAPEPGLKFDVEGLCWYREVPEEDEADGRD